MSFFGCCGAKKGNKYKSIGLSEYSILQTIDDSIQSDISRLNPLQHGDIQIDGENLQFKMYENIFLIIPEKSKGQKDNRYIDINTMSTAYAIIYDKNYREKDKQEVGIKFSQFDDDYSCEKTDQIMQNSSKQGNNNNRNKQKSNDKKQQNEDQSTKNGSSKDNQNLKRKMSMGDKTEISIYMNNKSQIARIKQHLFQKIQQTEFRWSYKTIEVLGEGSSGTVFNVFNRDSLHQYAAKVVNKQELKKEKYSYEAIIQEIDLMKEINSEYVIKMHEVFQDSINIYLILDLFNGGTLQQKMDQVQYRFKVTDIQQILKQLIQALIDLDSHGIMHRDIKPENILFRKTNSMNLVLCDLGLSTKCDIKKYLFQNVGTPGYVAPEVYYKKQQYSNICDVYSVGVILFQLLFHKLPFDGDNVEQILEKNKNNIINYDQLKVRNKVQQYGLDILLQMLEKDPEKRIKPQEILEDKFFTLKIEDEFTKVQPMENRPKDFTNLKLDVREKQQQQQNNGQKKEENIQLRNQIQDKYDFTLPKTPLMGKKPLTIENAEMRDKQQSVAESYFFNQGGSMGQSGGQSNNISPQKDDLLKKTLKNTNSQYTPQSPNNSTQHGSSGKKNNMADFSQAAANSRNKATTMSPAKAFEDSPNPQKEKISQFGRQKSNLQMEKK